MPQLPKKFRELLFPHRYKVFYGGRGGGKSWMFARVLLTMALRDKLRILCARELQTSIADSVHKLLSDQIQSMGFTGLFTVTQNTIRSHTGSEFIFKGLKHNAAEIKSMEGVDVCWVEEAANVSKSSWDLLIPTIRKENSEIWISFNPMAPDGETYQRFVVTPPKDAFVQKVSYRDNFWLPETLRQEAENCKEQDPEAYAHIWEGEPAVISDAQVFKNKYIVEEFETPEFTRFYYGVDWGFANDPTTMVRCFVREHRLYVEYEAWAQGLEIDELVKLFETVPGSYDYENNILADSSRPEIIKHLRQMGWPILGAKKWPGSIEEGVSVMRSFDKIVVHPRCKHAIQEFNLYSYKVDKQTNEILPVIVDKSNHIIDAIRYSITDIIRGREKR